MNIKLPGKDDFLGDFWGALAATLVALPSAIAFGVTIFAPLGGSFSAFGAVAGSVRKNERSVVLTAQNAQYFE